MPIAMHSNVTGSVTLTTYPVKVLFGNTTLRIAGLKRKQHVAGYFNISNLAISLRTYASYRIYTVA